VSRTFGNLAPSQIVVLPVDGSGVVPITDADAIHQSPAWSPDGRLLYYVSNRHGPRDIYVVSMSESEQATVEPIRLTVGLNAQSIDVSADGASLAYSVYGSRSNIWSLPVPEDPPITIDAAVPLTSGSQTIESLRVSPDGQWLVYDSDLRGNADIYRIPIAGGTAEQLTREPFDEFAADLSPDGTEIVYFSWETGSRDIVVRAVEGGRSELVTSSPSQESYPVWSPDGSRIAFHDQAPGKDQMYVVERSADGTWGEPIQVAERLVRPAWEPDGRQIIGNMDQALEVVSHEGGEPMVVYEARPESGDPVARWPLFSTDGGTIYFKSHDAGGLASFWSMPATGGQPRLLVRFDDPMRQSTRDDWAMDEEHFFFTIQDRQSDIWVMDVEQ
jgi:Tol biopolymer transport system component